MSAIRKRNPGAYSPIPERLIVSRGLSLRTARSGAGGGAYPVTCSCRGGGLLRILVIVSRDLADAGATNPNLPSHKDKLKQRWF